MKVLVIGNKLDLYIRLLGKSIGQNMIYTTVSSDNDIKQLKKGYNPDLIVFTGGADVNPLLYMEESNSFTSVDRFRDEMEIELFQKFKHCKKLGIGRGAQLLTVLSGGSLIQHVEGHDSSHNIVTSENDIISTTSDHHQLMNPYDIKHEVLAYCEKSLSSIYENGKNKEVELPLYFQEVEVVKYPSTKSLCIQGHPELSEASSEYVEYCSKLIFNHLQKKQQYE